MPSDECKEVISSQNNSWRRYTQATSRAGCGAAAAAIQEELNRRQRLSSSTGAGGAGAGAGAGAGGAGAGVSAPLAPLKHGRASDDVTSEIGGSGDGGDDGEDYDPDELD